MSRGVAKRARLHDERKCLDGTVVVETVHVNCFLTIKLLTWRCCTGEVWLQALGSCVEIVSICHMQVGRVISDNTHASLKSSIYQLQRLTVAVSRDTADRNIGHDSGTRRHAMDFHPLDIRLVCSR